MPVLTADFKTSTNPALRMEWVDATGAEYNGIDDAARILVPSAVGETVVPNMVQPQRTDAEGAPFPGGYLRLRNAGFVQGTAFDVIITVPSAEEATYPSDFLPIQYSPPTSQTVSQAALTVGGVMCLGMGVEKATCPTSGEPSRVEATCPVLQDAEGGSYQQGTIMRGEWHAHIPMSCNMSAALTR